MTMYYDWRQKKTIFILDYLSSEALRRTTVINVPVCLTKATASNIQGHVTIKLALKFQYKGD